MFYCLPGKQSVPKDLYRDFKFILYPGLSLQVRWEAKQNKMFTISVRELCLFYLQVWRLDFLPGREQGVIDLGCQLSVEVLCF